MKYASLALCLRMSKFQPHGWCLRCSDCFDVIRMQILGFYISRVDLAELFEQEVCVSTIRKATQAGQGEIAIICVLDGKQLLDNVADLPAVIVAERPDKACLFRL